MRNFKLSLLALCAMLLLVSRMAFALVEIPELTTRVTDLTGTLNAQEQASLESKLAAFESKKGSQIAVLIVPSTEPEVIEQYSIRVAQKWQLGREKTDDGVLVLIAKDDRKMRIEVGYGLEGAIPDVYAKRIVSDIMRPRFKQGDFYGGIDASVDALISIVDGEALPAPQQQGQIAGAENLLPLFLFGTIFLSLFLTGFLGRFLGSTATGGIVGTTAMSMLASTPAGIAVGIAAFAGSLMLPWLFGGGGGNSGYRRGGGYYGGGLGGGSSGGSSWGGGGGGDFGGGGASGDW